MHDMIPMTVVSVLIVDFSSTHFHSGSLCLPAAVSVSPLLLLASDSLFLVAEPLPVHTHKHAHTHTHTDNSNVLKSVLRLQHSQLV